MMEILQQLLTQNDCYRQHTTMFPKGVMVHSTGANNPNLRRYIQPDDGLLGENRYRNDWNRAGLAVCVHGFIGKTADGSVAVYQTLPWNYRGWHAGGRANDTHIGFEICEDDLSDRDYFEQVYCAAVELTAELCRKFALNPLADGVVIDHAEGHRRGLASNHGDVAHWFSRYDRTMNDFRRAVAFFMENGSHKVPERRYQSVDELPDWAKAETQELLRLGALRGNENGLDISEDMLRTMIINLRAAKALKNA